MVNMKRLSLLLTLLMGLFSTVAHARELLGSTEAEVAAWAKDHGYTLEDSNTGTTGCRKGKRYVQMGGPGVKVYALFYQPLYKENTQAITQVEFEPSAPVPLAKARAWGVQVAPIAGTRPGTHKQQIPASGAAVCSAANGGFEERYTNDYLLEFQYAPGGGAIERVFVTNENIRGATATPPDSAATP